MLSIHDNKIDSTNGVFNIEDTSNNPIKLYSNKIINTDNYIISDSYVFKKNTAIPFLYFALRTSSLTTVGTIQFNIYLKDWVANSNNGNAVGYFTFPSYLDSLIKAIKLRDYVLKGSWVQSRVAYSGDIGIAELNQWNSTHDFTVGRYNLSNLAPILVMDYAGPGTENNILFFTVDSNNKNLLNLSVGSNNYVFITFYVQFS